MSTFSLRLDSSAVTRASTLLPSVQTAYAQYLANNPHVLPKVIDISYVYSGAVGRGLNVWRAPSLWASYPLGQGGDVPTSATFTPQTGSGTTTVSVSVSDYDVGRADAIIAALGGVPTLVNVLGCACCTGLARLLGFYPIQGPFT